MKKYLLAVLLLFGKTQFAYESFASEWFTILSMYVKNPSEVGEIAPITQTVGIELAKFVAADSSEGKHYLEAGGGCGAVSVCIAEKLRPQDFLDVIEINPEMCEVLKERLSGYSNVSVHCCSVLDWSPDYQYDAVISTLPFLSLGIDFTKKAMIYFKNSVKKTGMFSCVEYPFCTFCRKFAQMFCSKEVQDLTSVQQYMAKMRVKYLQDSTTIYLNIPPINVYHLSLRS